MMWKHIRTQAETAIEIADCIIFVVDGKGGLLPDDYAIADMLRQSHKPVVLAVNKLDNPFETAYEFYELGLGDPFVLSAEHNIGIGDILEEACKYMRKVEEEGEEEVEYDEHVWLSVKNAQIFVTAISDALGQIDMENASYYKSNADSYINQLKDLDSRYTAAVKEGTQDTLVFADRFPFRYLVDDYNLKYYAAFIGCSAEANASFKTIAFLAGKIDELGLNVILIIESSDGGIANSVKEATTNKNQQIMVMDSIQSATTKEYKSGRNYLSIMTKNLDVLKEAIK